MKDLLILTADKCAEFALKGALTRPQALGIRPISFDIQVHPHRDGGARTTGPDILRLQHRHYQHALLVFDFEGSGTDLRSAVSLEHQLDQKLVSPWEGKAKAIVIEPELDVWVWGTDSIVASSINWKRPVPVRDWLIEKGFSLNETGKPTRPKEAFEAALKETGMPMSAALYNEIASKTSFKNCHDDAFIRLRNQLQTWFQN